MVQTAKLSKSALLSFKPWQAIATKPLAVQLGVDPYLLGMRRYRGLGPTALPCEWIKGHVNAFHVTDLLRWLGDTRTDVQQYSDALQEVFHSDERHDTDLVRLFARTLAEKMSPIGFEFTSMGRKAFLQSIRAL